ncbi:hypothetical protein ACFY15_36160 [Streptomyces sp. NPDC001373]|uniref:hypothetical protein n=1 Tax=Streptomyces sp. NPDC001373 TaxID=3364565 RepID=UPI00369FB4DD
MPDSDPLLPLPLPLPTELDQLLLIRRWLELVLARVDEKITAVRGVEAEKARRRPSAEPPQWWIEYGIGARRTPERAHTGLCPMPGRGRTASSASSTADLDPDRLRDQVLQPVRVTVAPRGRWAASAVVPQGQVITRM